MDKLIRLNTFYLGNLLQPVEGTNKLSFLFQVSDNGTEWKNVGIGDSGVVDNPVTIGSDGVYKHNSKDSAIYVPLSATGVPNNSVYEKLVEYSNLTVQGRKEEDLVSVRVPEEMTQYRVLTKCRRCEKIYPKDSDNDSNKARYVEYDGVEYFVIATGSLE